MDRGRYGRSSASLTPETTSPADADSESEVFLYERKAARADSANGLAVVMRACFAETECAAALVGRGQGRATGGAGGSLSLSVTVLKPRPGVKRPALTVRGPRRAYWAWRAGGARDLAFI